MRSNGNHALSLLLWMCFLCPSARTQQLADQSIPQFAISNSPTVALLKLGQQTKTPLGIICGANDLSDSTIQVTLKNGTLRTALDTIVEQMPGYEWNEDRGVIHVRPQTIAASQSRLLSIKIDKFTARSASPDEVDIYLKAKLREILKVNLKPKTGGIVDELSAPAPDSDPVALTSTTIAKVLDYTVSRNKGMAAWILWPPQVSLLQAVSKSETWQLGSFGRLLQDKTYCTWVNHRLR